MAERTMGTVMRPGEPEALPRERADDRPASRDVDAPTRALRAGAAPVAARSCGG